MVKFASSGSKVNLVYPVKELGVFMFPIYSLLNGEPRSYLEFPNHLIVVWRGTSHSLSLWDPAHLPLKNSTFWDSKPMFSADKLPLLFRFFAAHNPPLFQSKSKAFFHTSSLRVTQPFTIFFILWFLVFVLVCYSVSAMVSKSINWMGRNSS